MIALPIFPLLLYIQLWEVEWYWCYWVVMIPQLTVCRWSPSEPAEDRQTVLYCWVFHKHSQECWMLNLRNLQQKQRIISRGDIQGILAWPTPCILGNYSCFFVICWFFFLINFFEKNLSEIPSECQTVWTIRPAWSGSKLFTKFISRQHR